MSEFKSGFAAKLDSMLEYRICCGFKRDTHAYNLQKFDAHCYVHFPNISTLTQETVHSWLDIETSKGNDMNAKMAAIRQFGKYLIAIGEDSYVLPEKFAHHVNRKIPHMLTDDEISALFRAIDLLPTDKTEPFISEIAPTLFRLIYTCGLRPNEGRELLRENVNLNTGEVLITHTKRNRERIVVMSDDMLKLAREYELRRSIFGDCNPYFFPSAEGAFSAPKLLKTLNIAWSKASCSPKSPVPRLIRVYDLRHQFASSCLNRWLDSGENLMAMLPYLRAYMGHVSMEETAYYIHLLPENIVKSAGIDWNTLGALIPEVDV